MKLVTIVVGTWCLLFIALFVALFFATLRPATAVEYSTYAGCESCRASKVHL